MVLGMGYLPIGARGEGDEVQRGDAHRHGVYVNGLVVVELDIKRLVLSGCGILSDEHLQFDIRMLLVKLSEKSRHPIGGESVAHDDRGSHPQYAPEWTPRFATRG